MRCFKKEKRKEEKKSLRVGIKEKKKKKKKKKTRWDKKRSGKGESLVKKWLYKGLFDTDLYGAFGKGDRDQVHDAVFI